MAGCAALSRPTGSCEKCTQLQFKHYGFSGNFHATMPQRFSLKEGRLCLFFVAWYLFF